MSSTQPEFPNFKTKIWSCGDQSRFPSIPKTELNPWDTCLKPLLDEDRQRCEAWRDEIQNLLIFSGLFSAVVTAFVVQTYDDLQPDPQYYMAVLLAQFLQQQSNNTDSPAISNLPLNYLYNTPSASSIRTNICWFSSLVLSLIVVLVGTVALQWLREFQRYPSSSSAKKLFATRNLRAESFERWGAPQIIAGLPQILQLAVILFFFGLMEFLLQLNMAVAVPVIILAGLAMCFQALTTILPTLQSFWLVNKSGFSQPPLHCPYKSPQSWAFLRLMTSSPLRFFMNWIGSIVIQVLIVPMAPIVMISQMLSADHYIWKFVDRLAVTLHLKYLHTLNNWDEFDDLWLEERHQSSTGSSHGSPNYFHKGTHSTDYDAARGIAHFMNSRVLPEPMAMAVYHCFQRLSPSVVTDDLFRLMTRGLPQWLFALEGRRKGRFLSPSSSDMIKEENEMFLLSRLPQTINSTGPIHVFRLRQLELFVRVTAHMFANDAWNDSLQRDSLSVSPRKRSYQDPGALFVPSPLKDVKAMKLIPQDFALDIAEQLIRIFESYVTSVLHDEGPQPGDNSMSTSELEPILSGFMDVVHVASLYLAFNANPTNKTMVLTTDLAVVLDRITARLSFTYSQSLRAPRLYRCSKLYASRFHFTDWIPLRRRSPLLARSFHSLVHITSLYGTEIGEYNFLYLPRRFTAQWKELCGEVLRRPLSPIVVTENQPRQSALYSDPVEYQECDIDIAESIYPAINVPSGDLWIPRAASVGNISLCSNVFDAVGPSHPQSQLPTPATPNFISNHLVLPPRRFNSRSTISSSRRSDTDSTLHNSVLPLDAGQNQHDKDSEKLTKTYDIV